MSALICRDPAARSGRAIRPQEREHVLAIRRERSDTVTVRLVHCVVPAAAAFLLFAASARAEPTAADRETARTLMEDARDRLAQKDLKGALERFQQADGIMHVPTTGIEVARVQVALGQLVEARDTLAHLAHIPLAKHGEPEPFRQARAAAQSLDDELTARLPGLRITARDPVGGEITVTVDDVVVPVMGVVRKTDPGHHLIVATSDTGGHARKEVDLVERQTAEVSLVLEGGTAPVHPVQPVPASTEPAPISGSETPRPTPGRSHTLTYVGIGIAVAGVAVGAVTGLVSLSKTSSLQNECGAGKQCSTTQSQSDYDSASTMATVSTVAFIGAGVGAGVAIVGLLVGHRSTPPQTASATTSTTSFVVSPWLGWGAAGVRGQF